MNARTIVQALRRSWWVVAASVALFFAIGAGVAATATPLYASTVTFFVRTPSEQLNGAFQGDQFAQKRVNSYAQLADSQRLASMIVEDTQLGLNPSEVSAMISAKGDLNTVLLTLSITNSDPRVSLDVARSAATQMVRLVDQIETADGANTATVSLEVTSDATLQLEPVSPRWKLILLLSGLAGAVIGVAIAIARQAFDSTVKTIEMLRSLTDSGVLASIPFDETAKAAPLIAHGDSQSVRAEALRQLRTNLQFVDVDRPVRVITVTSAIPDEGKSSTAANLAVIFAESGQRVLLIEADLRRPRVAHYLGLESAVGLSNVLAGQVSVDEVLQPWGRGGLTVLASGSTPPNPSELLGSQNMSELLASLRRTFDIIIIDTPPLLPVTDGAVAAVRADGAILVVRYGHTKRAQVSAAIDSLDAVGAKLLGSVLNMMPIRDAQAYGYGTYYGDRIDESNSQEQSEKPADAGAPSDGLRSLSDSLERSGGS